MIRIGIAGILHESNTFAPPTPLEQFTVRRGDEVIACYRDTFHEVGGAIAGVVQHGFQPVPLMVAGATPSGTVTEDAFEALTGELVRRVRGAGAMDGLLLSLHGAMSSARFPEADDEIIRRVREAVGPRLPLVVTHDFHANVPSDLVANCDALVIYQTNPHVDQRERGLRAAGIVARMARGEAKPTQAIAKPPMLLNILYHNTSRPPLAPVMEAVRALEKEPGVLAAGFAAGYQYADVPAMGPSAVVVTDGDAVRAQREAGRLAEMAWSQRETLLINLPDAAEAVHRAMTSQETPVALADLGDNIGGGSAGDSTFILSELLKQRAQGWVVVICDPQAVQQCVRAGTGAAVLLRVGGKTDALHGEPVEVTGRVCRLHDGRYEEPQPRHGGETIRNQGLTALLECGTGSYLVLNSLRHPPFSLGQLTSLGIVLQGQRILVAKSAVAFRAAYEPVVKRIIEVDTPGLTAINPKCFTYRRVRRPQHGLD